MSLDARLMKTNSIKILHERNSYKIFIELFLMKFRWHESRLIFMKIHKNNL